MSPEARLALFDLIVAASFGDGDAKIRAYAAVLRLPDPADRAEVRRAFLDAVAA